MACDRCGARTEGGAYPSDDEGSQDLCFDCAVADVAKNVAEATQCAHGRRYGEPCPLQARVKSLEARVVAVTECRDQTYAQLSKAHERLESLELHFADEIAELEAEANVDAENYSASGKDGA